MRSCRPPITPKNKNREFSTTCILKSKVIKQYIERRGMAAEQQDLPEQIACKAQPLGISFHPSLNLLSAGLVDGSVELHNYGSSTKHRIKALHPGASSRSTNFLSDDKLLSAGSDGSIHILDTNSMKAQLSFSKAHESPINRTFAIHQKNLIASGDDEGVVKLWDVRSGSSCVASFENAQSDFISGFACNDDGSTLLSSSGDCTLCAFDLRAATTQNTGDHSDSMGQSNSLFRRSDDQEDELLSVVVIKNGKKVVCGTQEGILCVWSWGTWGDQGHRMKGHPQSIDALLKVDEDTIITGSSDGLLRVVQLMPDKLLGVIGDHEGFPCEELRWSHDRRMIGSISHDEIVRLWDVSFLIDDEDEDEDVMETENEISNMVTQNVRKTNVDVGVDSDDEWEDVDDDNNDMNSDSSDEDSDEDSFDKNPKKNVRKFMSENERFFQDL